jgi:hypothetical protein
MRLCVDGRKGYLITVIDREAGDRWMRRIAEPKLARRIIILERAAIRTMVFAKGYVAA